MLKAVVEDLKWTVPPAQTPMQQFVGFALRGGRIGEGRGKDWRGKGRGTGGEEG